MTITRNRRPAAKKTPTVDKDCLVFPGLAFAVVALWLTLLASCHPAYAGTLPDPDLTPGVARQVTLDTLCHTSTKLVRHTSQATKDAVYAEYNLAPRHEPSCTGPSGACYEIDHLIALTDGGADVKENLWPQLFDGPCNAHDKDKLEVKLHSLICDGSITLDVAQTALAEDWAVAYKTYVDEKGCE